MIGFFNLEKTGSKASGEIFIPKSTRDNPGIFTIEKGEIIRGYPNITSLLKNQYPPNAMPLIINWSSWIKIKRNSPSNSIQQWLYQLFFSNRSNASSLHPHENPWFESLETKKIDLSTENTLLIESGIEGIEFNYPEYSMFYIKGDAIGYNLKPLKGGNQGIITRIYQEENSLTIKDENLIKNPISLSLYFILAEKKNLSLVDIVNLEVYNLYHDYLFEIMLHTEDYVDYLRDCSEPIPLLNLPYKLASLLMNDSKAKKVKGFYPIDSGSIYDYYRSPFSLIILLFTSMAKVKGSTYDQQELKIFRNSTLQMYFEQNKWNHNQLFIIAEHKENLQLCMNYIAELKNSFNSIKNAFKEKMDILSNDFKYSQNIFESYDLVYEKIKIVLPKINELYTYYSINKKKKARDFENNDEISHYLSKNEEITSELTQIDEIINNQPLLKYLISENHNNILYRYYNYDIKGKFQIYTLKNFIKELKSALQLDKQKRLREQKPKLSYKEDYMENLIKEYDLKNSSQKTNITEVSSFLSERNKIGPQLLQLYGKYKKDDDVKKKITTLAIQFYSQYLNFNPFDVKIQHFPSIFNSFKNSDFSMLEGHWKDNNELMTLYKQLIMINNEVLMNQQLKKIAEETKELKYDVPQENMFTFLLDFSQIIPDPNISKIQGSDENEYTLKSQMGNLYFKILEKEQNKKLTYKYDFLTSTWGEKGILFITFDEPISGSVTLKVRNEIQEVSKTNIENLTIMNIMGTYLKTYLDLNLGKVVAKQVQTIFYEKSFDDLTMGNYRILQAKFNMLGKDINELKARFFEVKSPLTLNSFECSECGATLNITSKEEKFIICDHCSTPFLMEWQKG